MGKTSQTGGFSTELHTESSVLSTIIETEAQVNAEIEKARIASRERIIAAQKNIPDIVAAIEAEGQETARLKEQEIMRASQEKIAKIQEEGSVQAAALRTHLDENYQTAVDYIVGQVIHTNP